MLSMSTQKWLQMICIGSLFLLNLFIPDNRARAAGTENKVKPGEFVIDPPTLINLAFEWVIEGDDNRNAHGRCFLSEKKVSRIGRRACLFFGCTANVYFSRRECSMLFLRPICSRAVFSISEPDTAYEARFILSDPDGLIGHSGKSVTKTVTVRTRPEPKPSSGGRVFHVYPPDYKGTKIELRRLMR